MMPPSRPFGRALARRPVPLCPEITLWLLGEDVDLEAGCEALHEGEPPPYWAFCWGAGQALARHVIDHPEEVAGRRVVDLGSGCGIAAIAAARMGATTVTAVDVDPAARDAALANAHANGIPTGTLRVAPAMPDAWDVLLAADVLYESGLGEEVRRLAGLGRSVLASEPGRPGNPGHPEPPLVQYAVRTFPDVDSPTRSAAVYRLGVRERC